MTFWIIVSSLFLRFLFCPANITCISAIGGQTDNKSVNVQRRAQSNFRHDNTCKPNSTFAWCLPSEYDKKVEPWRYRHMTNSTMPWHYYFNFFVFEVEEVNDKKQTITLDMYFIIKWSEPRLHVNFSSPDWDDLSIINQEYSNINQKS